MQREQEATTQTGGSLPVAVTFVQFFGALGLEVEDALTMDAFAESGRFKNNPDWWHFLMIPGTGGKYYQKFMAPDGTEFEFQRVQWNPVNEDVAIFGERNGSEFILNCFEFASFLLEHGLNIPASADPTIQNA